MITISAGPCLLVLALGIAKNKKLTSECSAKAGKRQVRTPTQARTDRIRVGAPVEAVKKKRGAPSCDFAPLTILSAISSRLDQSEVSILSFIKHPYPVRVSVA